MMFWKKLSKISALVTAGLGVVYLIWMTINKWLVVGNTKSSTAKEIGDGVIYGCVNYILLSIITLALGVCVIALIVSVTFMIIDTFNRVHGVNEPSFLSDLTNRPKQQPPYNPYGNQPPMNMGHQPPMNNNIGQPPMR